MKSRLFKPVLFAFSTLSSIPIDPGKGSLDELKHSVVFYPLVGLVLGGLLALVGLIPMAPDLGALLLLLVWVLFTAAFHLDGLADCLDGFFGGRTPKERRRIMKDSAVGVYGLTGIVLLLVSKYVLLSHDLAKGEASQWLIAIPVVARWAIGLSCLISKAPSGDKGLGSQIVGLPVKWFLFSTFLSIFICGLLLKLGALWAFLVAIGVSVGISRFSKARIGGLTGDGMGATVELTEVCLLFLSCFKCA